MINILIADDHVIFIEALVSLLGDVEDLAVVGTATDGEETIRLVEEHPGADLLVLDISMPGMDGVGTLTELRSRKHRIPTLMLTQELSAGTVARAMRAGASGYLLKTAGREEFLVAIRTVVSGGEYISDRAKDAVMARLAGRERQGGSPPITRRELEVLRLVAAGKTTTEIATQLFVSPYTVETHRRNLLQKLGLRNAAALVRYALDNGLMEG